MILPTEITPLIKSATDWFIVQSEKARLECTLIKEEAEQRRKMADAMDALVDRAANADAPGTVGLVDAEDTSDDLPF